MELQVTSLDGKSSGKVTLADDVFGLEPRQDLLQRMVRYQLLKRQAGTHDVKNRAEIALTTKKFVRQKGSGGARHGAARRRSSVVVAVLSVRHRAAMRSSCPRRSGRLPSSMRFPPRPRPAN